MQALGCRTKTTMIWCSFGAMKDPYEENTASPAASTMETSGPRVKLSKLSKRIIRLAK